MVCKLILYVCKHFFFSLICCKSFNTTIFNDLELKILFILKFTAKSLSKHFTYTQKLIKMFAFINSNLTVFKNSRNNLKKFTDIF